MKQIRNNTLLYAATAVLLLAGCSREPLETPEDGRIGGEFVSVTLPMQVEAPELASVTAQAAQDLPAMASAGTRAADPGAPFSVSFGATTATSETAPADWTEAAPATRAGTSLSNVWVLQFNAAGQNVSTSYVGTLAAGAYLTAPSLQVGSGYTICVVANGAASGLTTSNPATLSDFETTMLHKDAVTAAAQLPMSGKLTDVTVVNLGSGKGKISVKQTLPVVVVMSRILAEVTLTVDFGVTDYTLTGAQLYDVPIGAAYGWNSATTTFPADNSANFGYTTHTYAAAGMTPLTTTTAGTKTTYKWFIGDNRRGEVAGLTDQTYRNSYTAPAFATFARITLTHSRYVTQKLFYEIYLGSGVMTNFDVKRNRTYTQTATIKGTAEAHEALIFDDPRVSSQGVPVWLTDNKHDSPFLISARGMQSTRMIWGPTATIPAAQDIYDGKKCTDAIMAVSATAYPPAKYCRDQGAEWYLPAQAELMLMWIYLPAIPLNYLPGSGDFWSSTEYSNATSFVWCVDFSFGSTNCYTKSFSTYVRCVREN